MTVIFFYVLWSLLHACLRRRAIYASLRPYLRMRTQVTPGAEENEADNRAEETWDLNEQVRRALVLLVRI